MITDVENYLANNLNVSRETLLQLHVYVDRLTKWNKKINLVSNSTIDEIWSRHILDSAQLFSESWRHAKSWIDLGSGAGFPGMVVAILAKSQSLPLEVSLIESDSRKCEFLRHIARQTNTPIDVQNSRVEESSLAKADIVSARALAPLSKLLEYAHPLLKENGHCLFLKGSNIDTELDEAARLWHINYKKIPSVTDSSGVILQVSDVRHV